MSCEDRSADLTKILILSSNSRWTLCQDEGTKEKEWLEISKYILAKSKTVFEDSA